MFTNLIVVVILVSDKQTVEDKALEFIKAYHKIFHNGQEIYKRAMENTALCNVYGRDAPHVPQFKNNVKVMSDLKEENIQLDLKYGGYIPTAYHVIPNPDFSKG